MKIIFKSIVFLIILIFSTSCVKEEMIKSDPSFIVSFQREGQADAMAGSVFYIIRQGSGEFFTLFDGSEGHVWGEEGAKGKDFNKADSLSVQYNAAGQYNLTVVSSSTGNFGNDFSRNVKSIEINVLDHRNLITVFNMNGVDGVITKENEILFSIPDNITDFNFIPAFGLNSNSAKAFVNGVEQTSLVTSNNFKDPVVYTVKSAQGDEQNYTVKVSTFPSSNEKAITKFAFGIGGNGEVGIVDEENKIINIISNYSTNLASVRLILASSYGSLIYVNNAIYSDRKNYNLSSTGIKTIKVVAQNNSEIEYAISATLDNPVNSFTFSGLVPAPVGIINFSAKTISIDVLKGTDLTKLAAKWIGSIGKVTIGTVVQSNGTTINDFTAPVTYTFYKGSAAGDKYTVTVNVK